ncbi:MAG: hypothetical protein JST82_17175, partial [Bacteroidetes bacterium]|nr:hypothetical protein [Bacteroidota bacterium]
MIKNLSFVNLSKVLRTTLVLIFVAFCGQSYAQTSLYSEGADLPSVAGSPPTYTISSAGTYTVSGSVATPGDQQDAFYVTVNSGLQITAVQYSMGAPGTFQGFMDFNLSYDISFSPGSGSGNFSSAGLSYPVAAGTYFNYVAANFSVGNSWTYTYTVTSTAAAPSITTNPSSTSACSGNNATFTVAASNSPTSYTWQVNTGSGYSNISNGGVYSSATTATLSITGATAGMNGYLYRALATNGTGTSSPSSAATLTVNSTPGITTNPSTASTCAGGNTTFTVAASNSPTSYTWQVNTGSGYSNISNGGVYSGATTATLSITGATAGMNGYLYRAIANNSCGSSSASSAATLTVNSAPSITSSPSSTAVCNTSGASFSVGASNSPTSYTWQVNSGSGYTNISNGGIYSGATTTTLNISSTTGLNGYLYRAIANNACGSSSASSAATLTVTTGNPVVVTAPSNATVCSGGNTTFSVNATNVSGYQWYVIIPGPSIIQLSNGGVYSGVFTNTLTITGATGALNGNQYYCILINDCSPLSNFFSSGAATLTVNSSVATPVFTLGSTSTRCQGAGTVTYGATASNSTGITYSLDATTLAFAGNSIVAATGAVTYAAGWSGTSTITATATGCNGPSTATHTVTTNALPAVVSNPSNATICAGSNTSFSASGSGAGIGYQWQENTGSGFVNIINGGIYSTATTATLNLTGVTAGMNSYTYRCLVSGTCTPAVNSNSATLTVNTAPSVGTQPSNSTVCAGNNTSFTVVATGTALTYQWQESQNSGTTWNNLTNTGVYSNVTTTGMAITGATVTMNGYMYRCVVSGTCAPAATSSAVTLTVNSLPAITTQPSAQSVCPNTATSFTVAGSGTGITYQWQLSTNAGIGWVNLTNTAPYSTVTTTTLNISTAASTMNGYLYRCVVTGTCSPAAVSNSASLTILTPIGVNSQPSTSTVCLGTNASFSTTGSGTGIAYQWQESTNGGSTWNNLTASATYTNVSTASLTIVAPAASMSGYLYRCNLSGTCTASLNTNSAILTVNTAPSITSSPSAVTICEGTATSMSVTATGSGLSYQWQYDPGTGFVNCPSVVPYVGSNSATLSFTNPPNTL